MIKTTLQIVVIATLAAFAASCTPIQNFMARQDFGRLCTIAKEFEWSKYKEDQAAEMALDFYETIDKKLSSSLFKKIWRSVSLAAVGERYELLKKGASEVGANDFDCPPVKDYMEGRKPQP